MDGRHGEVLVLHGAGQPIHLSAGVAVDDGLGDGEGLVQVAQRLELPALLVQLDVELLDTLQRQLVLLHQDAHRVAHELLGDLQNLQRHGGGEEGHLHVLAQGTEGLVDLVLEAAAQHLIGLIQAEQLALAKVQQTALDQIVHTAGSTDDDLHTTAQLLHILLQGRSTHAAVHADVHVLGDVAQHRENLKGQLTSGGHDQHLRVLAVQVQQLQSGDAERTGLTRT